MQNVTKPDSIFYEKPSELANHDCDFFSIEIGDGKLNFAQWTYCTIQNGGAEVVPFGQCLHYTLPDTIWPHRH